MPGIVLRQMRRDRSASAISHEVATVVGFVCTQRTAGSVRDRIEHHERRGTLAGAGVTTALTTRPLRFSISTCPLARQAAREGPGMARMRSGVHRPSRT
jgi:hypothetical protein